MKRGDDRFLNSRNVPDLSKRMCGVVERFFEDDISLAVCMEESFADSVDRDWLSEFFVGLKIVYISRHRVSAA